MSVIAVLLALALPAEPGAASPARRPAHADARVHIEGALGPLKVTGWDRAEVEVSGSEADLDGPPDQIQIDLEPGRGRAIEVRVPAGAALEVESQAGDVTIAGVRGTIKAESAAGAVTVSGESRDVEAGSMAGEVNVACACTRARVESVNGSVTVKGASGDLEASTVNGVLRVEGGRFSRAILETVAGPLRFAGELDPRGRLEVQTVSGDVELALPAETSAEVSVTTFTGRVTNELSPARPAEEGRHEHGFTLGSGGATISIETLSGAVRLVPRR